MRRTLYAVLLAGLFLLMLSALVVTPESVENQPPMRMPQDFHAIFRPVISAILPEAADAPAGRPAVQMILGFLPLLCLCAVPPDGVRDANGRVLCALRYENSVYQLFRPEIAGG